MERKTQQGKVVIRIPTLPNTHGENSRTLSLANKTQLSTMQAQSTLLRPTPKIANYKSYWMCISARRGFSASPPGVKGTEL